VTYDWSTGIFPGSGVTITDWATFRIEPPVN
jgi:hypothetical protein